MKKKTYNHVFLLGFSIPGSTTEDASDVTEGDILNAVMSRISDLYMRRECRESVGPPEDTYEERPITRRYDPADYDTYIGEPTKCAGCGWNGDPQQEGIMTADNRFLCNECHCVGWPV